MTPQLALAMLQWATPIVMQAIREHRAQRLAAGQDPNVELTDEQVFQMLNDNIDKYLAEGAAWRAQHPDA